MRVRYVVLFFLMLGLTIVPTLAQDATTLSYGQVSSGTLNADSPTAQFSFDGQQGDTIYAAIYDTYFSVTLRLLDSNSIPIEQSEGSILGDWLLGPVTLPADDTYTLVVTRPDWESQEGDFNLRLDTVMVSSLEEETSLDGHLEAGQAMFFTYQATAGTIIRYALQGASIGLEMAFPSGNDYFSSGFYDNPGNGFNKMPETGVYFGFIQTQSAEGTDFSFQLSPLEPEPIMNGSPISDSIASGSSRMFTFDSAADKLWRLSATFSQTDGDGYLAIFSSDSADFSGDPLVSDCCSGPNNSPRIDPFTTPEDGTYYVILDWNAWSEDAPPNDFELTLTSSTLVSLSPGVAVTGTVSQKTGRAVYVYNATAGDVIQVTLRHTGGTGIPNLGVYASNGDVLHFDGQQTRSATFEIEVAETGVFRFEVTNTGDGDSELDFSLLLETAK